MGTSTGAVGAAIGFVGREADLQAACADLDAAIAGSGGVVLVTGEAGIGKTSFAEAVARHAVDCGAVVRWGRAPAGISAPPYWPFLQIIREHAAQCDAATLRQQLGDATAALVRAVPSLSEDAGAQSSGDAADVQGEQARFTFFDAVARFLRRAAEARPMLLVLDDLHWTDVGTLLLLRYLCREMASTCVLVVGAYRDVDVDPETPAGRLLADVAADARTIALRGLEVGEVRELLSGALGPHEVDRIARDAQRRSGGNPLFLRELVRLLHSGGGGRDAVSVPHGVRAVIDRRLGGLEPSVIDVLTVAAAIGESFAVDVLAAAVDGTKTPIPDLLAPALTGRLLAQTPDVGRLQFSHALVRDVLYDRVPPPDRPALHDRIGRALLACAEHAGGRSPIAEVADHLLRAVPVADANEAVDAAVQAGDEALAHLAYEDAAAMFERAVAACRTGGLDMAPNAYLLLRRGDAQLRAGLMSEARESFVEAADLARSSGDGAMLARAALGLGAGLDGFEVRHYDEVQLALLEEALIVLPPGDSSLRAWTTARLSVALTFSESTDRRLRLAREAVDMARRAGDDAALCYSLGAYCDAIAGPDHSEERLVHATEMVAIARAVKDRGLELLGRRLRFMALLELGDVGGVDAEIDAYERTAEALGQPLYLWYVPLWRGMRALMHGRAGEARDLADHAAQVGRRAHSTNADLLTRVLRWSSFLEEGRFADSAAELADQIRLAGGIYGDDLWCAIVEAPDKPLPARAALERLAARGFAEIPFDAAWLAVMCMLADAAAVTGTPDIAADLATRLTPYARRFAVDGIGGACFGPAGRFAGIAALAAGRREDAARLLEQALADARASGCPLLVAHACAALAGAVDGDGAVALGAEARSLYAELGFALRAHRLDGPSRALPSAAPARGSSASGTLRREGDVWLISFAERTVRLRDSKGIRDLAVLFARPGREVHVADLIAPDAGLVLAGATQQVLDPTSREAYRRRIEELRDELADAEAFGESLRASRIRDEMDGIVGELASALGLGSRTRNLNDPAERVRKAVRERIRNAIKRIGAEHPELGRHLDVSIRTGRFCSYQPDREVAWEVTEAF